jgi:hypothetical protein
VRESLLTLVDAARAALHSIHEQMMSVVDMIQGLVNAGHVILQASNYNQWNDVGARTTQETVATLTQLYQRQRELARMQNQLMPPPPSIYHMDTHNAANPAASTTSIQPYSGHSNRRQNFPQWSRPPSIQEALQSHNWIQASRTPTNAPPPNSNIGDWNEGWDDNWDDLLGNDLDSDWEAEESSFSPPQVTRTRNGGVTVSWSRDIHNSNEPQIEEESE